MKNTFSIIGKVHIKNIKVLKEWHASGGFKKWHNGNWSHPVLLQTISDGKILTRSHFTKCRIRLRDLSKVLTRRAHGLMICLKWQSICKELDSPLIFSIWTDSTGLR